MMQKDWWAGTGLNRRHQDFQFSFHPGTMGHYWFESVRIRLFPYLPPRPFCPMVPDAAR